MALSARMRQAIRLYETGAAKTMKEASAAVGFHPATLTVSGKVNPAVLEERERVRKMIDDKAIDMSLLLNALGRQAIGRIVALMDANDDRVALRAAMDIADRAPSTSKIQRHQVTALTLDGKDAATIAEALVKAAQVRQLYPESASGDFVKVTVPETDRADG